MPRNVRTARGEIVDFDAIIIKQQIAQAPMNVEVARRKDFIDSKESRSRGARQAVEQEAQQVIAQPAEPIEVEPAGSSHLDFEVEAEPTKKKK